MTKRFVIGIVVMALVAAAVIFFFRDTLFSAGTSPASDASSAAKPAGETPASATLGKFTAPSAARPLSSGRSDEGAKGPYVVTPVVYPTGSPAQIIEQQRKAFESVTDNTQRGKIALVMATALQQCSRRPPSEEILAANDEKSRRLRSEHAQMLAVCNGVNPEDVTKLEEWMRRAADLGDVRARLSYHGLLPFLFDMNAPDALVRDAEKIAIFKSTAMTYLQLAANDGAVDALTQLAYIYESGIMLERDRASALAYALAVQRTEHGQAAGIGPFIDGLRRVTSPEEQDRAVAMSDTIFAQCCAR